MGVAILHVTDHEAKTTKDFTCSITLLLQHMKLLTADLEDVPGQDVEVCSNMTFQATLPYNHR